MSLVWSIIPIYGGNFSTGTFFGWDVAGQGFGKAPLNLTLANNESYYYLNPWSNYDYGNAFAATTYRQSGSPVPGTVLLPDSHGYALLAFAVVVRVVLLISVVVVPTIVVVEVDFACVDLLDSVRYSANVAATITTRIPTYVLEPGMIRIRGYCFKRFR